MLLAHHRAHVRALREPSARDPWRVLVSGCLAGWRCGVDGTDNGVGTTLADLLALPTVRAVAFCPEQHALGTPRGLPDLHGGDGFDALAARAQVLDDDGRDVTAEMIAGADAMLACAVRERVELAILTDMSAACGSQVISDGARGVAERRYQKGVGVATARLLAAGIPVVSQRDFRTLALLRARLQPGFVPPDDARDHHEHPWTIAHLPGPHPRSLRR
jgi:uncharacterized protein YbbK (DUF523 family)